MLSSSGERQNAQQILARQVENISRMVDDLLDISRLTEGKVQLRRHPVSLESILTVVVTLVRSSCAAQGQELTLSLPPEPVFLNADATRMEQVFGNLLTNACKYSGDGSHISVTAEVAPVDNPSSFTVSASSVHGGDKQMEGPKCEVIVRVRDNGSGIAPELLPHIFDLFVQSSRSRDRSQGGLGIGLTLVRRLVEEHGGSVEARSEGPDQGSEFVVHLPIMCEIPTIVPLQAPSVVRETACRILIVDDNIDSAKTFATLLKRRGHDTRVAFTGHEALTSAVEFLPEVVLLDIGLPGKDGFEVAREIRSMPALAGIFLIAMSGYGANEDKVLAQEAGFDKYLVKPVRVHTLADLLHERDQPSFS